MAFPPDDSWFRKLLEEQKRLEKFFNPIPESLIQHQRLLDSINLPVLRINPS